MNYVLRGMKIPAGTHEIEFKFEPKVIEQGKVFSLTSYALLFFVSIGWFFYEVIACGKPQFKVRISAKLVCFMSHRLNRLLGYRYK